MVNGQWSLVIDQSAMAILMSILVGHWPIVDRAAFQARFQSADRALLLTKLTVLQRFYVPWPESIPGFDSDSAALNLHKYCY